MSHSTERPFLTSLRAVDATLAVPLRARIRVLHELEYDLERLREHLIAEGLPPEEAIRRAEVMLVPDRNAASSLGRVHLPAYLRMMGELSSRHVRRVERGVAAAAVAAVVLLEAYALLQADLLTGPSPFLWPVLVLGAVLGTSACGFAVRSLASRDAIAPDVLALLPAQIGVILTVATLGALVDTYRLAAALEAAPDAAAALTLAWLARDAALVAVALLLAMVGGLAWFGLAQWSAFVAHIHREALGFAHVRIPGTEAPS